MAPPRRQRKPVRPPASRCITPEGYARLQAEQEQLWRVERPRVTHEVSEAAALGDRSENAEYIYGKKRLREIDRRLRFLGELLDRLTVVRAVSAEKERVFFGAWVTLEDAEGEQQRFRIVGPDEIDAKTGLISVEAPMGLALLGREVGDEVVVHRPKGRGIFTILEVRYDPSP